MNFSIRQMMILILLLTLLLPTLLFARPDGPVGIFIGVNGSPSFNDDSLKTIGHHISSLYDEKELLDRFFKKTIFLSKTASYRNIQTTIADLKKEDFETLFVYFATHNTNDGLLVTDSIEKKKGSFLPAAEFVQWLLNINNSHSKRIFVVFEACHVSMEKPGLAENTMSDEPLKMNHGLREGTQSLMVMRTASGTVKEPTFIPFFQEKLKNETTYTPLSLAKNFKKFAETDNKLIILNVGDNDYRLLDKTPIMEIKYNHDFPIEEVNFQLFFNTLKNDQFTLTDKGLLFQGDLLYKLGIFNEAILNVVPVSWKNPKTHHDSVTDRYQTGQKTFKVQTGYFSVKLYNHMIIQMDQTEKNKQLNALIGEDIDSAVSFFEHHHIKYKLIYEKNCEKSENEIISIQPKFFDRDQEYTVSIVKKGIKLPNVITKLKQAAEQILQTFDLAYMSNTSGAYITNTYPAPDTCVERGSEVQLYLGNVINNLEYNYDNVLNIAHKPSDFVDLDRVKNNVNAEYDQFMTYLTTNNINYIVNLEPDCSEQFSYNRIKSVYPTSGIKTTTNFVINAGIKGYTVPNLISYKFEAAKKILKEQNFLDIKSSNTGKRVIKINPPEGECILPHMPITLELAESCRQTKFPQFYQTLSRRNKKMLIRVSEDETCSRLISKARKVKNIPDGYQLLKVISPDYHSDFYYVFATKNLDNEKGVDVWVAVYCKSNDSIIASGFFPIDFLQTDHYAEWKKEVAVFQLSKKKLLFYHIDTETFEMDKKTLKPVLHELEDELKTFTVDTDEKGPFLLCLLSNGTIYKYSIKFKTRVEINSLARTIQKKENVRMFTVQTGFYMIFPREIYYYDYLSGNYKSIIDDLQGYEASVVLSIDTCYSPDGTNSGGAILFREKKDNMFIYKVVFFYLDDKREIVSYDASDISKQLRLQDSNKNKKTSIGKIDSARIFLQTYAKYFTNNTLLIVFLHEQSTYFRKIISIGRSDYYKDTWDNEKKQHFSHNNQYILEDIKLITHKHSKIRLFYYEDENNKFNEEF